MPLPPPVEDVPPPRNTALSERQYNAILHDGTILPEGVRFTAIRGLQDSVDPSALLAVYSKNEDRQGPVTMVGADEFVGHVMPLTGFFNQLALGYLGNAPTGSPDRLEQIYHSGLSRGLEPAEACKEVLRKFASTTSIERIDRLRTKWYFLAKRQHTNSIFDEDLALRLALPSACDSNGIEDYIVLLLKLEDFAGEKTELVLPRFTDAGSMDILELWTPGGYTSPIKVNRPGMREALSRPFFYPEDLIDVRYNKCTTKKHP